MSSSSLESVHVSKMRSYLGIVALLLVIVSVLGEDAAGKDGTVAESGADREGKLGNIVGFYSQTTLLSIFTQTTSAIWTCLSTTNTVRPCNGRRRRRALIEFGSDLAGEEASELDGSVSEGMEAFVQPIEKIDQRTGRRITVWSTLYSTLQLFVTNGIAGSTVTVSAICNVINNVPVTPGCFVG